MRHGVEEYLARKKRAYWTYLRRRYPDAKDHRQTYTDFVLAHFTAGTVVLDAGSGRGGIPDAVRNEARRVIGLDLDRESLCENPALDGRVRASIEAMPLADASIDLILCHNVVEHLPSPEAFFREASRVLRPQGLLVVRTPNTWHPWTLAARLLPEGVVRRFVKITEGREEQDLFPTLYRANSLRVLGRLARQAGLVPRTVQTHEVFPPFTFSMTLLRLGLLWWELVTRVERLRALRWTLLAAYRKG